MAEIVRLKSDSTVARKIPIEAGTVTAVFSRDEKDVLTARIVANGITTPLEVVDGRVTYQGYKFHLKFVESPEERQVRPQRKRTSRESTHRHFKSRGR